METTKHKGTQMDQFDQVMLIDDLVQIVAKLPKRDNIFAGKIIKWFDARGSLSAKQVAVVREILSRNQGV
jgi:acyl-CoA hydrolase